MCRKILLIANRNEVPFVLSSPGSAGIDFPNVVKKSGITQWDGAELTVPDDCQLDINVTARVQDAGNPDLDAEGFFYLYRNDVQEIPLGRGVFVCGTTLILDANAGDRFKIVFSTNNAAGAQVHGGVIFTGLRIAER